MVAGYRAHRDDVQGGPHFFPADGSDVHDPGIAMHPDEDGGSPLVDSDDPSVDADLVRRAAGQVRAAGSGG